MDAKSQRDYRRSVTATDQFGRPWLMQLEIATGDPTGGVIPGFTDPLRTPLEFIKVPKDDYDQPKWGQCFINLHGWMTAIRNAETEWRARLYEVGTHAYKNKFDPAQAENDGYLLELAGPKPWPSVQCLEALRTGNQHLAGKVTNEKGQAVLDEKAKQLMAYKNIVLDPVPLDEDEFNMVKARQDEIEGAPAIDDSMAPESTTLVTGTTKEDYLAFQKTGIAGGMTQPEVLIAWKLHKELIAEAAAQA